MTLNIPYESPETAKEARDKMATKTASASRIHVYECSECGFQSRAQGSRLTVEVHQKATGHNGIRELWL